MSSRIAWTLAAAAIAVAVYVGQADSQQPGRVDVAALPFSAARQAGDTLYVSGQIPVGADGSVVKGSIHMETSQVMQNIGAILIANGYDFEDVVSVTVYLSDMRHYEQMNRAYREFFPDGTYPARACVGGLQIAFDANIEIQCVAYKQPESVFAQ